MIPTPAIRNLIREDKIHQVYSQMQIGQGEHGMQTFNQSMAELVLTDQLERDVALSRSSQPAELLSMLEQGKGLSQVQRKSKGY
jgi:twitching motility protein PilT